MVTACLLHAEAYLKARGHLPPIWKGGQKGAAGGDESLGGIYAGLLFCSKRILSCDSGDRLTHTIQAHS
jgi:hypothetical protein